MKILWVNPPDLEGPTDEEPGYTAVTEDPLLSLTWDTSTPFAVGGSVGTFAWQHCLMLSVCVCVCVIPCERHLSEALTCMLQSHCRSSFPNIHFHSIQEASPDTDPSCRKHKLKTWTIPAFLSQWAAWRNALLCINSLLIPGKAVPSRQR